MHHNRWPVSSGAGSTEPWRAFVSAQAGHSGDSVLDLPGEHRADPARDAPGNFEFGASRAAIRRPGALRPGSRRYRSSLAAPDVWFTARPCPSYSVREIVPDGDTVFERRPCLS